MALQSQRLYVSMQINLLKPLVIQQPPNPMLQLMLCLALIFKAQEIPLERQQYLFNYTSNDSCASWNPYTRMCTLCSEGYRFDAGRCIALYRSVKEVIRIIQLCAKFKSGDISSLCSACKGGYTLTEDKRCVPNNTRFNEIISERLKDGMCMNCPQRSIHINGICIALSPLCATWDRNTGLCLSCYIDNRLVDGKCFKAQPLTTTR